MSNLGLYQVMTTASKAVGGPLNLLLGVGGIGYGIGKGVEAIGKGIVKRVRHRMDTNADEAGKRYIVHEGYRDEHGLRLRKGDRVRVLETDGDSYLVEKIGDKNNPYFVSGKLLKTLVTPN